MGGPLGVGAGAATALEAEAGVELTMGRSFWGPRAGAPPCLPWELAPGLGEAGRKVKLESGPGSFVAERDGGGARVTFKLHPARIQEGRARLGQ